MTGVEGIYRFLGRIWRLIMMETPAGTFYLTSNITEEPLIASQRRIVHATIKKVTSDIEHLSFNTAISQMMICVNTFLDANPCPLEAVHILLRLLSPFAPHLAEELWMHLAAKIPSVKALGILASESSWPIWNEDYLIFEEVTYVVKINGKLRTRLTLAATTSQEDVEKAVLADPSMQAHLLNQTIQKVIVVPGRLVNIVIL
jgi:leucyl-tRNA synthetase